MDHNEQRPSEIYLRKREIATMRGLFLGSLLNWWSYAITYSLLYWAHFGFSFRFPEDVYKDIILQAFRWGILAGSIIGGTMGAKSDLEKQIGSFSFLLFQVSFFVGAITAFIRHFDLLKSFSFGKYYIILVIFLATYPLASFAIIIISPRIEKWHSL